MENIERSQAEKLLEKFNVCYSRLKQNSNDISIFLKLSNGKTILMKYNIQKKNKSFYLE